jgi:hypothetical protein
MTTYNIKSVAKNKFFAKMPNVAPVCAPNPVEQIVLETEWTAYLQKTVDFGNRHYLRNFSLRLEMDEENDVLSFREENDNNVR